ncbi:hypothetical protein CNMCM5793_003498 [Aspergillus hiratsukae]|uniref:Uncharacterized protein n=1 Tax=Aspergillus hiratsukae TaxID=1194566 RepID=A0A8H6Q7A2_9EURO|nr:hypothetical protein CNMCM5793_003498 [Aspergillus hiratsukae]KAF7168451.1 hypothetical protein CNMCM6106_003639 [Aspergillus hiratsukae]
MIPVCSTSNKSLVLNATSQKLPVAPTKARSKVDATSRYQKLSAATRKAKVTTREPPEKSGDQRTHNELEEEPVAARSQRGRQNITATGKSCKQCSGRRAACTWALVMLPAVPIIMVTRVAVDALPALCLLDQATENTRYQRVFRQYYRDPITFTQHSIPGLPSRVTHAAIAEILHASWQGEKIDELLDEYKQIRCLSSDGSRVEIWRQKQQGPETARPSQTMVLPPKWLATDVNGALGKRIYSNGFLIAHLLSTFLLFLLEACILSTSYAVLSRTFSSTKASMPVSTSIDLLSILETTGTWIAAVAFLIQFGRWIYNQINKVETSEKLQIKILAEEVKHTKQLQSIEQKIGDQNELRERHHTELLEVIERHPSWKQPVPHKGPGQQRCITGKWGVPSFDELRQRGKSNNAMQAFAQPSVQQASTQTETPSVANSSTQTTEPSPTESAERAESPESTRQADVTEPSNLINSIRQVCPQVIRRANHLAMFWGDADNGTIPGDLLAWCVCERLHYIDEQLRR